ncbi:Plexin-A1 [Araneus ventricosus]|uniref:Plexin-A1 n=1 Tax=Araneus ventricosus TaxID=182803 RepID=A0A4Y2DNP4_ARAVE|nr:Plexin-A1 [Araneus ventricosus]
MTVHDYTERIYIGSVNRIYQLSRDLKQEDVATMGPKYDSPQCPVTQVCPNEPKRPTDYYNKALVVDYSQSKLIACGSLFQGTCTVHDLNQVSNYETPANESVVANNATASTVAFIAPGPKNLPRTHVLYVGVSYTGNGPYSPHVPAVSSRSLDPSNTFEIAHSGVTTETKIMLNSMFREIYPITYVYGFSSKGFSYFVTVQKMSTDLPRPFISKLVRVCQRDVHYYSYTEVPLVCRSSPDGIDYNLVQSAYVGKPGSELAKSLGISAQESVLFAVFAKSKDEEGIYNKPSPNSALCVYALSAVHRKFTQNIQHCFNGYGELGMDFIYPSQPCYPTQLQINDDFCGMDVNTPLAGSMAVEAAPVLRFPGVLLTAVAATSSHDSTMAFLGTSQGHLKKSGYHFIFYLISYFVFYLRRGESRSHRRAVYCSTGFQICRVPWRDGYTVYVCCLLPLETIERKEVEPCTVNKSVFRESQVLAIKQEMRTGQRLCDAFHDPSLVSFH